MKIKLPIYSSFSKQEIYIGNIGKISFKDENAKLLFVNQFERALTIFAHGTDVSKKRQENTIMYTTSSSTTTRENHDYESSYTFVQDIHNLLTDGVSFILHRPISTMLIIEGCLPVNANQPQMEKMTRLQQLLETFLFNFKKFNMDFKKENHNDRYRVICISAEEDEIEELVFILKQLNINKSISSMTHRFFQSPHERSNSSASNTNEEANVLNCRIQ